MVVQVTEEATEPEPGPDPEPELAETTAEMEAMVEWDLSWSWRPLGWATGISTGLLRRMEAGLYLSSLSVSSDFEAGRGSYEPNEYPAGEGRLEGEIIRERRGKTRDK